MRCSHIPLPILPPRPLTPISWDARPQPQRGLRLHLRVWRSTTLTTVIDSAKLYWQNLPLEWPIPITQMDFGSILGMGGRIGEVLLGTSCGVRAMAELPRQMLSAPSGRDGAAASPTSLPRSPELGVWSSRNGAAVRMVSDSQRRLSAIFSPILGLRGCRSLLVF